MNDLEQLTKGLIELRNDWDSLVTNVAREFSDLIVKLNRDQLESGIRADDRNIQPPYTASTIRVKRSKGQPTNRVTLRDTGDLHRSLFVEFEPGKFSLHFEDEKAPYLLERYGKEVLGLNEESLEQLRQLITQRVAEEVVKKLGNGGT